MIDFLKNSLILIPGPSLLGPTEKRCCKKMNFDFKTHLKLITYILQGSCFYEQILQIVLIEGTKRVEKAICTFIHGICGHFSQLIITSLCSHKPRVLYEREIRLEESGTFDLRALGKF